MLKFSSVQFSSIQSLSCVWLFATPWTAVHQASLSIINSQSLLKFMSIESVMPSNYLVLCCPLLLSHSIFPSIRFFPMSQFFASGGQSIRVSVSASVFSMNILDWFPLGWTDWISLQSKELSRVFSNTTVQKHHTLSRFVIAFLPRSKSLLISWLQSLSTVILETKKIETITASTFHWFNKHVHHGLNLCLTWWCCDILWPRGIELLSSYELSSGRTIKSAKELMLLNRDAGDDSWESLGLQGDQTSAS